MKLTFEVLPDTFGICKLDMKQIIPKWAYQEGFFSVTKTEDELSIVCSDKNIPEDILCDRSWKAFKVQGILDFALVGILAKVTTVLANEKLGIFAISTYNTDYILVKATDFDRAVSALCIDGHKIIE